MSEDPVISVRGVSKAYRIWESPSARILAPLQASLGMKERAARSYRDFWALKDVSFEVRKGEAVGIIGRNGSGKSTLLQIIAGTLQPTAGSVKVNGRVAALLELGSGFNPEFTGRENVFLNGAVLGLSRSEIEAKFDSIAEFADIGEFIDQPIKTYSSGMTMRLAFAVQSAVTPDILIVDEALSVGDAPFQAKCFNRMRQLANEGVSTLFVSHSIATIKNFCSHAIWLHAGQCITQGQAAPVCDAYQRECLRAAGMHFSENTALPATLQTPAPNLVATKEWDDRSSFEANAKLGRQGSGPARIRNFYLSDLKGHRVETVRFDQPISACYELHASHAVHGLFQIGLSIKTMQGTEVVSVSDRKHALSLDLKANQAVRLMLHFELPLSAGKYYATTSVFSFPPTGRLEQGTYDYYQATVMDRLEYAFFFEIADQTNEGIYGPVHQEGRLRFIESIHTPSGYK